MTLWILYRHAQKAFGVCCDRASVCMKMGLGNYRAVQIIPWASKICLNQFVVRQILQVDYEDLKADSAPR